MKFINEFVRCPSCTHPMHSEAIVKASKVTSEHAFTHGKCANCHSVVRLKVIWHIELKEEI